MAELAFDSTQHKPMRSYSVIPKADYPMEIVASEKKETNAKDGYYLNLEIEVTSGEYKGSRVWVILNLWNKSEKARAIANEEMTSICQAVGILKPQNSEELHKIPFIGSVKIAPAEGKYPEKNEMVGYKPYDPNKISASPSTSTASSPAAKASKKPDWMNKKKEEPTAEKEEPFDAPADGEPNADDIPL